MTNLIREFNEATKASKEEHSLIPKTCHECGAVWVWWTGNSYASFCPYCGDEGFVEEGKPA